MCRFIDDKVFTMTNAVTALVSSMIVLVVAVIFWVCNDTRVNKKYHEEISTKLDKIQGIALNAQDILKESSDTLNIEALEDLLEAKIDAAIIEEKSSAIDSNNYMALILTLVTLCVSLSAVIPYIVGKSISKFEIKNVVEDLYAKDKHDVSVKYRENVNMLLASEAHLSRVTAYELLTMIPPVGSKSPSSNVKLTNSVWAIGWASKALIRYITSCNSENYNSYKDFAVELLSYIDKACEGGFCDFDENTTQIAKRSFLDLLNAIVYNKTLYKKLIESKQLTKLKGHLNTLYGKVAPQFEANINNVIQAALKKSHYQLYLDAECDQDTFKSLLEDEVGDLTLTLDSPDKPQGDSPDVKQEQDQEDPQEVKKNQQNKGKKKRRRKRSGK